jgi:glycerol dehydrogenase
MLPELMRRFGKNGMILASPHAKNSLIPEAFPQGTGSPVVEFSGECTEGEINRVMVEVQICKAEVLVGMGGGKTIDTAKIVADKCRIPVIVVPTIASTDAPCSGCAVVYTDDGVYSHVYDQRMNPEVVLVDLNLIARAPVRFLVAGMGDALATWFEARSCDRTQSLNTCGGYSTLTALTLARLCYDTLLRHGVAAKLANENRIVTPALNHIVEANTLLSGLGFESSGLAAAHSIHNGLTAVPETHAFYHGEKVAFGVLAGLHLTDADPAEIEEVHGFCLEVGLPVCLADLGIMDTGPDALMKIAMKACAPGEWIHNEAGEITPLRVVNAMVAADAMGKRKRAGYNFQQKNY